MNATVVAIGGEGEKICIIDNAIASAEAAVELAVGLAPFPVVDGNLYPGLRLILTPEHGAAARTYVDAVCAAVLPVMQSEFGMRGFDVVEAGLSIVTTPASETLLGQRIPHADTCDSNHFAVLHYLCSSEHGGTGFFRHRLTGFELVSLERRMLYSQALQLDLEIFPPGPTYPGVASPIFEHTYTVDAAFNRILVYRSALLHSGMMPDGFTGNPNPRVGRLTGNLFLKGR